MYDSPTSAFFNGVYSLAIEFIQDAESDFGKGFRFLIVMAVLGAVVYALYYISMNWFIWTVPIIALFFAALDATAWIGSSF